MSSLLHIAILKRLTDPGVHGLIYPIYHGWTGRLLQRFTIAHFSNMV